MKIARDPDRLRELLEQRDLTQREMGLLTGCSRTTVLKVLNGERVGDPLAKRIARVLRHPTEHLFAEAPATVGGRSGSQQKSA